MARRNLAVVRPEPEPTAAQAVPILARRMAMMVRAAGVLLQAVQNQRASNPRQTAIMAAFGMAMNMAQRFGFGLDNLANQVATMPADKLTLLHSYLHATLQDADDSALSDSEFMERLASRLERIDL